MTHLLLHHLIKLCLQRCNKLRRAGRLDQAAVLSDKINNIITSARRKKFTKLQQASTKELWASIKGNSYTHSSATSTHPLLCNIDAVNQFFAARSFMDNRVITSTPNSTPLSKLIQLFMTMKLSRTCAIYEAPLLVLTLYPTGSIVTALMNYQLLYHQYYPVRLAKATSQIHWRKAFVTRIPKLSKPSSLDEYRPISVTPILSRLAERIAVKRWLLPSIPLDTIQDQFAFRPTGSGSTTAALVSVFHHVTRLFGMIMHAASVLTSLRPLTLLIMVCLLRSLLVCDYWN